ncbi:hypothetical protein Emag_001981 [Eimeria magna]
MHLTLLSICTQQQQQQQQHHMKGIKPIPTHAANAAAATAAAVPPVAAGAETEARKTAHLLRIVLLQKTLQVSLQSLKYLACLFLIINIVDSSSGSSRASKALLNQP